jgi:hypothetical protein
MHRKVSDWGGNIAAFAVVIMVNAMANGLPINNQTTGEVSAKYPSLFTPAGFTFSIWGLIYLSLAVFVIYQALPAQRDNATIAAIGRLFILNCIANAAWIFAWHYDLLVLSLILMAVILLSLVGIYRFLNASEDLVPAGQRWCVQLPFSLYTAWITVATIANISVVQLALGWDDLGMSAVNWTILKLALAGAIAAIVVMRRGDLAFGFVVAWAAFGIMVNQGRIPAVAGAATMLTTLILLLSMAQFLRRRKAAAGRKSI